MKKLKVLFLFTDIGFIIYWLITALHLIPINLAFKDYNNPILVDWNWSFFPFRYVYIFNRILSFVLFE
ncbi:DUF5360 family protein [Clostridium saccharobutylicum]|uniref:DUF5360 family protein n=1 Tax=Clostridium saccharobutylicum TaxID=169679 RepID=UPI00182EB364|nr:DUF5360 family protein [Clostridium saccharobutylicum]MBA9008917.1 hypothetical protein [Clostridium saccharobutylicum]